MKDKDQTENGVEVLLLMPHTHAGIDYQAGDIINVSPTEQEWLAQRGVCAASNK